METSEVNECEEETGVKEWVLKRGAREMKVKVGVKERV